MPDDAAVALDPYSCLAKRTRKYASECTEVYLAKQDSEAISENFSHFTNVEVAWLNGNRLSRVENLESNFRIREVYVQDNRLVSLSGLRSLKFLRVLLASNNQLRNLEKQLSLLSRFAFLKKLDLFGNPVAEEPDYRLRLIYHVPQVEILDRHPVKGPERLRADEVVPNLDKVSAAKPERAKRRAFVHSELERSCFRLARQIAEKRRSEVDEDLCKSFSGGVDRAAPPPEARAVGETRSLWSNPRNRVLRELLRPTPWEQVEMRPIIERRAGKAALTRDDVVALAETLARDGVDEVGRVLGNPHVLATLPQEPATAAGAKTGKSRALAAAAAAAHPLDKILQNPAESVPVAEVANWLLTLEWPRPKDEELDRRIEQLHDEAKRAEYAGDAKSGERCRNALLRFEGLKTRKHEVVLGPKEGARAPPAGRKDIFTQSLLRPSRTVDEATGRLTVKVAQEGRQTHIGG